jgi:hypothetical protein
MLVTILISAPVSNGLVHNLHQVASAIRQIFHHLRGLLGLIVDEMLSSAFQRDISLVPRVCHQ